MSRGGRETKKKSSREAGEKLGKSDNTGHGDQSMIFKNQGIDFLQCNHTLGQ